MTVEEFCSLLPYRPKWITKPSEIDDGVQVAEFRRCNGHVASFEFGRDFNTAKDGFYFYFEVLDMRNYREMDFIPIDSSMRRVSILWWPKTDDDYKRIAAKVAEALKWMHSRRAS